jgi:serine protease Do
MSKRIVWLGILAIVVTAGVLMPAGLGTGPRAACAQSQPPGRAELEKLAGQEQLSKLFAAVAEAVSPAVVEVRVTELVEVPASPFGGLPFDIPFPFNDDELPFRFRRQPAQPEEPRQRRLEGLGSGVIVDAKNGYVVTNEHVVGGADKVEVVLGDNRKFRAEWVRADAYSDVAVLKIPADNLAEAPLGNSDDIKVGDWVMAIGSPRGLTQTVTAGIISAKGRANGSNPYQRFLQTDAAINRGNSGGPLVNMRGEVIGLNNSIATFSGGFEGIGFAIPSNMVRQVMQQLIEGGQIVRGYLGIIPQDADTALAKSFNLPNAEGALVAFVEPGSPADKAGLKAGDFIVAIGDRHLTSQSDLRDAAAQAKPGEEVEVTFYRNGQKETARVKMTQRPERAEGRQQGPGAQKEESARRFGITVQTLTGPEELARRLNLPQGTETQGVVITQVAPDSDAAEQDLSRGMVITHVQDRQVRTAEEFYNAMKEATDGVRLRVAGARGGYRWVFIQPRPETDKSPRLESNND